MTSEVEISRGTVRPSESPSISGIDLEDIIRRNQKGADPVNGKFDLVRITKQGNHPYCLLGEPENGEDFYADGEEGFVVRTIDVQDKSTVVCGASFYNRPIRWDAALDDDPRNYPRVVQLQGCTKPGDSRSRRGIVMSALSLFCVEDVLLDVVTSIARSQGAPAVAILPAEANPNSHRRGFSMERAVRRYDHTAARRGFTRKQGGLYIRELDPTQQ